MNQNEARAFLTWVNQHDPRVEPSPVNAEVWAHALGPYDGEQVKAAALEFYRTAGDQKISPGAVRALVQSRATSAAGKRSAAESQRKVLDSPPRAVNPRSWRARNPELWDQLYEKGKHDRLADLRRRGII